MLLLLSRMGAAATAVEGKMEVVAALPTLLLRGRVLSERKRPVARGAGAGPPGAPGFAAVGAAAAAAAPVEEVVAAVLLMLLLLLL